MLYCKECGKSNDLLSNFCSKCGTPFVSFAKTTTSSTKIKFKPRVLPIDEEDADEDDSEDNIENLVESQSINIQGLEFEVEQFPQQKTTIGGLLANPKQFVPSNQPKITKKEAKAQAKQTIEQFKKEAGTLRPK